MTLHAVIPAAGIGSRMQADIPKQYLQLAGKSVIEQTINRLLQLPGLANIVVALGEGDPFWPGLEISNDSRLHTVTGGKERADSVLNGLQMLRQQGDDDDWVLVHDAARPCVRLEEIRLLIETCVNQQQGGILAIPVHDTMKRSDSHNRILETVPRENLWHACTPQLFRIGELTEAIETALDNGYPVTDEASAMEHAGQQPLLVECSVANIKITRPDDLALAEFYLRSE
ncbi:MAG: 2-C-methyl-D-erythritol 4-phosphate cytidylyltransferase [Sedimenticolaceae bacterium]|nr:2-C-methyl-D-erythritol 4-phosphate cytidylyltransferase [Sedimenticolaceae bacterium]